MRYKVAQCQVFNKGTGGWDGMAAGRVQFMGERVDFEDQLAMESEVTELHSFFVPRFNRGNGGNSRGTFQILSHSRGTYSRGSSDK